jgi:hypothetical protein
MSPAIIRTDRFSVHVYSERGAPHHRPHCHLRRRGGGAETVIALPLLDAIVGPPLSNEELEIVAANLQRVVDAWDELNGEDG